MAEYLTAAAARQKYSWDWYRNLLISLRLLVIVPDPTPTPDPTPEPTPDPDPSEPDPDPSESEPEPSPGPAVSTVWNTPVKGLPLGDQKWAHNLIEYGDTYNGKSSRGERWASEFGMGLKGEDYGVPIYYTSGNEDPKYDATTTRKVRHKAGWVGIFNVGPNEEIPWNPLWRPSDGKDGYMLIIDPETGHEWGLWSVSWEGYETDVNNCLQCSLNWANRDPGLLPWLAPAGVGYNKSTMLCAASAYQVRDPEGNPVDVREWKGNFPGASGGGYQLSPVIVTPDEVKSGRINHALHFYASNTMRDGDFEPKAVAPAGQHEGAGQVRPREELEKMVPEGTRFFYDLTPDEIEEWLNSKGFTGILRDTMKVIVTALVEYGFFVGDSSPYACHFTFASAANPVTRKGWVECGIPEGDASKSLLNGLPQDKLRVVAPPTAVMADGTESKGYGRAIDIYY